MASLNKVLLIGNLGRDPETRFLPSGGAVCNFSIATTESWKDKQSGQKQERTDWHNIVIYGRLAEIAGEYLKKGSSIYIEGRLQTRKWQDKQTGADRYTTEIVADEMKMLGGRPAGGANPGQGGYEQQARTQESQGQGEQPQRPAGQSADWEDDIPF